MTMDITQEEIISQFETLLQRPVEEIVREAAELKAHFYRLQHSINEVEREKYLQDGGDLKEYKPLVGVLEDRFKEQLSRFKDNRAKHAHVKATEEKKNLELKRAVIADLKELIDNEENIGKSFERFKDLQDRWREIGSVPSDAVKDLQATYKLEIDRFYYNITINKELKEYDLAKNLEIRLQLVSKLEDLRTEEKIKDVELILAAAKEQWEECGPVRKEDYPALRERYFGALRDLHKRIQDHYNDQKEGNAANLEAKQALLAEVVAMVEQCGDSLQKFNKATERIEEIKTAWNAIGPVDKKLNAKVWKDFKEAQDAFYTAKKALLGESREVFKNHRSAKQDLIAKANALKDSTDWKETTEELKRLQQQWKAIGSAGQRDENKLWNSFREACDAFFTNKKNFFDTLDDRQADNLKAKEEMLKVLDSTTLTGSKDEMLAAIKALNQQWSSIGHVPKNDMARMDDAHRKVLDKLYAQVKMDRSQTDTHRLKDKLERVSLEKGGSQQVDRELRNLQQKLKEKESELFNYENNLAFFANAKKDNPLLAAALKNIESLKVEVDELRKKLKVFRQFS
jgi:hypothetical protein